jgi:hypothetical protein
VTSIDALKPVYGYGRQASHERGGISPMAA